MVESMLIQVGKLSRLLGALICILFEVYFRTASASASDLLGLEHFWQKGKLCEVLADLEPGESKIIETVGFFPPRWMMLWDPMESTCLYDVQPAVFVAIDSHLTSDPELQRVLEARNEGHPVLIAFQGVVEAPPPIGPDDLGLHPVAAFGSRIAGRKQEHPPMRLTITQIFDFRTVTRTDSFDDPKNSRTASTPIRGKIPEYPRLAWIASIEGDVVLDVRLAAGRVQESKLVSGDRLLAIGAYDHLKSWEVDSKREEVVRVTYRYRLELRKTGQSTEPRILLELPSSVEITAAKNGWF